MIFGLTGGLASGKSTVENIVKSSLGFNVIDCDQVALQLLSDESVISAIVLTFGPKILDENHRINRAALAKLVFNNTDSRKILEAIIHPRVVSFIDKEIKTARLIKQHLVISAPLFIEANLQLMVDKLVTCECGTKLQLLRAVNRGMEFSDASARISAQLQPEARIYLANRVIWNLHSKEALKLKTLKVFNELCDI